jgi:sugar lactone lactonase YvrE
VRRGVALALVLGALFVPAALAASTPVLAGLAHPGSPAFASDGTLYFTQAPDDQHASIWKWVPGAASAVEVHSVSGAGAAISYLTADAKGNIYFAEETGGPVAIVRLDPKGKATRLYETSALVTAL